MSALKQATISVVVTSDLFHRLPGFDLLDGFKERHRDKRFVNALKAGSCGPDANEAGIERVIEEFFQTAFGDLLSLIVGQPAIIHFPYCPSPL